MKVFWGRGTSIFPALLLCAQAGAQQLPVPGGAGSAEPRTAPAETLLLPSGAPVRVSLDQELSTKTSKTGDMFPITVLHDVTAAGLVVIPKGTRGEGEVILAAGAGGYGRAGMIMITLRSLDLGEGRSAILDGRFRLEGRDNNGAAFATAYAVGIFAALVKGKTSIVPKGAEFTGHTGEDITIDRAKTQPQRSDAQVEPEPVGASKTNITAPEIPGQSNERTQ